jgi:starch phosphorylase
MSHSPHRANYLMARWLETGRKTREAGVKVVGYLSAEYLLGRQLGNALLATDLPTSPRRAWSPVRHRPGHAACQEVEPGLGNGGLGRLAACFIDSLATMNVPCIGYGIRYEYGIFRQTFVDGRQVEQPDTWLQLGSPWEFPHPEASVQVNFGGHTETFTDEDGVERRAGSPAGTCSACPTTTWSPATSTAASTRCACGAPRPPRRSTCRSSTPATTPGRPRADVRREHLQGALPRGLDAAGPELRLQQQYFFVAARCATSSDKRAGGTSICTTCPSGSSSSSTTPTR